MTHTVAECTKKLVVLLDKLTELDESDPLYRHKVADAKMLAQELSSEQEFLDRAGQ
tara:strand:- start:546 stop:713 length:168 start_codon:yes stop_codon:yes gene_type:complete